MGTLEWLGHESFLKASHESFLKAREKGLLSLGHLTKLQSETMGVSRWIRRASLRVELSQPLAGMASEGVSSVGMGLLLVQGQTGRKGIDVTDPIPNP